MTHKREALHTNRSGAPGRLVRVFCSGTYRSVTLCALSNVQRSYSTENGRLIETSLLLRYAAGQYGAVAGWKEKVNKKFIVAWGLVFGSVLIATAYGPQLHGADPIRIVMYVVGVAGLSLFLTLVISTLLDR